MENRRTIWNHPLYIVGTKSINGELVILATDQAPETALEDYAKRWGIESLFKCLKTSGFNFEDTHLTNLDRVNKLMALLAIAFTWAYLTGEWKSKNKRIRLKTHGRKEKSVFRLGLDVLGEIMTYASKKNKEYKQVIKLLSCT